MTDMNETTEVIMKTDVSGQQNPSRIFAIALASLAKMSVSGMPTYGIYATASVSTSMGVVSAARALSQCTGSRLSSSSAGGLCISFSKTHSK